MRLDLAQYRELAAFSQFSSDLDQVTKARLDRGVRITEVLKQGWDKPVSVVDQVLIVWAVTNGYLDQIPVDKVKTYQEEYLKFVTANQAPLKKDIAHEKVMSDKIIKTLEKITTKFNLGFKL